MKLLRKNGLRATALGALAVSGALVLTACGSDNNSGGGSGSSSSSSSASAGTGGGASASSIDCGKGSGNLLASGSTAQQNAMDTWVKAFTQACSGVQINYKGIGSGAGVQQFLQGQSAFAGSDSVLKAEQITQSKKVCTGGQAIDLPMVGGPIALVYNVPGADNVTLDASAVAKIFNSQITKWNDPAIAKLNPGVKLPATAIQPFHRSDDSGTTDNFTKYLTGAAKQDWPYSGGQTWQAKGGQSAQGSANVASQVKQTAGAIGYVELSFANSNKLPTVQLDTGASAPVKISSDNASKAIADAKVVGTGGDLALQLNYTTKAEGAWPIDLVTNEIVCDKGNKAETLDATKSFLNYIASDDAQKQITSLGYAPLPENIASQVRTAIGSLS